MCFFHTSLNGLTSYLRGMETEGTNTTASGSALVNILPTRNGNTLEVSLSQKVQSSLTSYLRGMETGHLVGEDMICDGLTSYLRGMETRSIGSKPQCKSIVNILPTRNGNDRVIVKATMNIALTSYLRGMETGEMEGHRRLGLWLTSYLRGMETEAHQSNPRTD